MEKEQLRQKGGEEGDTKIYRSHERGGKEIYIRHMNLRCLGKMGAVGPHI